MPPPKAKGMYQSISDIMHGHSNPHCDSSYNSSYNTVNLRIETNTSTLWEGPITSGPRIITLGTGEYYGSIPCNGQNGFSPGANPGSPPGNTPTDALDAAAKIRGFGYDGDYAGDDWHDFNIRSIGGLWNWGNGTVYTYWGIVVNWQPPSVGNGLWLSGCQQLLNPGDEVLWAYMPIGPSWDSYHNPEISFLKLTPTIVTVKKGQSFTVTVIDGRTGNATQNAVVAGVKTDAAGQATIHTSKAGFFTYKASRTGDVRSNAMYVTVAD